MEEIKKIEISDRIYKLVLALIIIIGVFLLLQILHQWQSLPQNTPREINFSGEGKAYAKPDIAVINFGVATQAVKSQDAVNQNNKKMNVIIEAVKKLGVEDKDIQTISYNLSPVYGQDKAELLYYPYPISNNRIVGYSLNQQIQVKIRNFDKINDILDQATIKEANMVGNLRFTVDDMEKVRAEARAKAISQAKEKAMVLARQTGLSLEKLVNVSEGYYGGPLMPYGAAFDAVAAKESVAPDIQTGQLEVSATVNLTYRVR